MTGPRTRVLLADTLLVVTGLTGFTGAAPPAEVGNPTDSQVTVHGEDESDGNKVMVDTRVGTRMYVRIAGELRPQLSVEDLDVVYHDNLSPVAPGRATVSYQVRNTGNVRLEGTQAVRVDLPWGPLWTPQH